MSSLPKDIPLGQVSINPEPVSAAVPDTAEKAVEALFAAAAADTSIQLLPWIEREFTLRAMEKTGNNQVRAAEVAGHHPRDTAETPRA